MRAVESCREIPLAAQLVLLTIDAVYSQILRDDYKSRASSTTTTIAEAILSLMIAHFPVRIAAERVIHDFFANVHNMQGSTFG